MPLPCEPLQISKLNRGFELARWPFNLQAIDHECVGVQTCWDSLEPSALVSLDIHACYKMHRRWIGVI